LLLRHLIKRHRPGAGRARGFKRLLDSALIRPYLAKEKIGTLCLQEAHAGDRIHQTLRREQPLNLGEPFPEKRNKGLK
jgi:hypothetical protein